MTLVVAEHAAQQAIFGFAGCGAAGGRCRWARGSPGTSRGERIVCAAVRRFASSTPAGPARASFACWSRACDARTGPILSTTCPSVGGVTIQVSVAPDRHTSSAVYSRCARPEFLAHLADVRAV